MLKKKSFKSLSFADIVLWNYAAIRSPCSCVVLACSTCINVCFMHPSIPVALLFPFKDKFNSKGDKFVITVPVSREDKNQ